MKTMIFPSIFTCLEKLFDHLGLLFKLIKVKLYKKKYVHGLKNKIEIRAQRGWIFLVR